MVSTLELTCYSSAATAALAYLTHRVVDGQSTLPIEVNGKVVYAPKALVEILFDLSNFSLGYNSTMSKIHEGPPPPEDQYALVVQADRKCHAVRERFNVLYDRVTTICANGGEVEDNLLAYREEQRLKINEIEELLGGFWTPARGPRN